MLKASGGCNLTPVDIRVEDSFPVPPSSYGEDVTGV